MKLHQGVRMPTFSFTEQWARQINIALTEFFRGVSSAEPLIVNGVVISKKSGDGVKVDTLNPSFPWRDITGQIAYRGVGATDPALAVYITNIKAYQFAVGDECWMEFHIPHDYVKGTDLHIHTHWSITTTAVETCTWGFDLTYAKGHNQAAFHATVNKTAAQATGGTAYQHYITEVQITGASGLTLADIEPDGLVLCRAYLSANTGAIEPFLHFVDLHYQSTGIGTKQKAPDFYS